MLYADKAGNIAYWLVLSHFAKYRSLMPALALIVHLIDGVAAGPRKASPVHVAGRADQVIE